MFGFLTEGNGLGNAFQPVGAGLPQALIGFPSLFAAFLVDVVRCVGCLPVGLSPGGDTLVDGIMVVLAAPFGHGSRLSASTAWL